MDSPVSADWQGRFARHPWLQGLLRKALYVQFEILNSGLRFPFFVKRLQKAGLKNLARGVKDPTLRQRLTPNFALGCKRILLSNTWYRTLAQKHVTVMDGVREIQGNQIFDIEGRSAQVDVLIFATGFEVAHPPIADAIVGASGQKLTAVWQGSAQAYMGTMLPDCPNLFLTFGPNLYTFSSAFVMIEAQLQFIQSALKFARHNAVLQIAVDPVRLALHNQQVQAALQSTVWNSGCASYFLDRNGRNSTNWPWTTFYMRWRLRRFQPTEFVLTR
jgi:cation diffusion facilitator CzcD-associated flavoprotein CzcO